MEDLFLASFHFFIIFTTIVRCGARHVCVDPISVSFSCLFVLILRLVPFRLTHAGRRGIGDSRRGDRQQGGVCTSIVPPPADCWRIVTHCRSCFPGAMTAVNHDDGSARLGIVGILAHFRRLGTIAGVRETAAARARPSVDDVSRLFRPELTILSVRKRWQSRIRVQPMPWSKTA